MLLVYVKIQWYFLTYFKKYIHLLYYQHFNKLRNHEECERYKKTNCSEMLKCNLHIYKKRTKIRKSFIVKQQMIVKQIILKYILIFNTRRWSL